MDRVAEAALLSSAGNTGFIGGGRPIASGVGDMSQLLRDSVAPHFEMSSVWHESLAAEAILCMDCQGGVMAVLGQSGSLQVIDAQEDTLLVRTRVKNPYKVFVEPTGSFVVATSLDGEVYVYAVFEERLLASFSLHPPSSLSSGYLAAASSVSAMLRGTVHVGQCVHWVQEEREASFPQTTISKAGDTLLNLLIGTQKGGFLFYARVTLSGDSQDAKVAIRHAVQLPDFFAGGGGVGVAGVSHVPVASVVFERVGSVGAATATSSLAVSTPLQLYRVSVPAKTAGSADQLLGLITNGGVKFNVKTVNPSSARSGFLASYGTLSVFRSHAGSPARSYAWSSVLGVVHGLLGGQPGEPLSAEEESLFADSSTADDALDGRCWCAEATIPFAKVKSDSRGRASEGGGKSDDHGNTLASLDVFPTAVSPSQVVQTAFHMILVYEKRCIVLNHPAGLPWRDPRFHETLSRLESSTNITGGPPTHDDAPPSLQDIVSRVRFDPFRGVRHMEPLKGVVRDVGERKLYVYSENQMWELQIDNEHRQQWRLFLDRAMADADESQGYGGPKLSLGMRRRLFDAAYNLCRYNDAQRSVVQYLRGRFYLAAGAVDRATSVLADCEFVEHVIANLLLPSPHAGCLADYLAKRFSYLVRFRAAHSDEQQEQQREELATFAVLAISLTASKANEAKPSGRATNALHEGEALTAFLDKVVKGCEAELPGERQRVVFDLLLHLLEDEGHSAEALYLAERTGRHTLVLAHHLACGNDRRAVELFAKYTAGRPEVAELLYRHAGRLLSTFPIATVTALLKVCAKDKQAGRVPGTVNMARLLPVLADYTVECNEEPDNLEHQIVILLEQCILHFECVSTPVHDYYIRLLAEQGDVDRLEDILEFSLFFDVPAALRACLANSCFSVAILLYKRLGLYEDAVLTALQEDAPPPTAPGDPARSSQHAAVADPWPGLTAAEELLRGLQDKLDEEAYKRLWQIIAEFAIERSNNARLALSVVDHSDGALQLADVLGSIDDSHVVQEFKGAICASLDRYTSAAAQLHEKQKEAYHTAEEVKRELGELRSQCDYVTAKQQCPLCHQGLLHSGQPMLVYANCHHVVHERCAIALLDSIGGIDAFLTDEGVSRQLLEGVTSTGELAQVDCVVCGEAAIVQTDIPLCEVDPSWAVD